jgi:hypothetical protein
MYTAGIAAGSGVATVVAVILALTYAPAGSTSLALSYKDNGNIEQPGSCGDIPARNGATVTSTWTTPSSYGVALIVTGANSASANLLQTYYGSATFT